MVEEMETMYQIRQARRQRIEARAEDRRVRDEARRRDDDLRGLREFARNRAAISSTTSNELRERPAREIG